MHISTIKPEYFSEYLRGREIRRRQTLEQQFGEEVVEYLSEHADLADPGTEVLITAESFNIEVINVDTLYTLINLKRVNDICDPNVFFRQVNRHLPKGGYYIGCVETIKLRKMRILAKFHNVISYPYYFFDFIIKRIFPKFKPTRRVYSILTRGVNRVMSLTETLGRLTACGFEVVEVRDIGFLCFFVCRKTEPTLDQETKNYGIFIKLKRVGKDGRLFNVYKFRTMHPYAEYMQGYVHGQNNLADGCKFKDDFRITSWGRVMRKLWIDELPMFINFFRGDMKLVGVRPLSEQYFQLYPEDLQQQRTSCKPGLVPPFYADLPVTFDDLLKSERKYLEAYEKSPWLTDFKYFWAAWINIIFKKARSA